MTESLFISLAFATKSYFASVLHSHGTCCLSSTSLPNGNSTYLLWSCGRIKISKDLKSAWCGTKGHCNVKKDPFRTLELWKLAGNLSKCLNPWLGLDFQKTSVDGNPVRTNKEWQKPALLNICIWVPRVVLETQAPSLCCDSIVILSYSYVPGSLLHCFASFREHAKRIPGQDWRIVQWLTK